MFAGFYATASLAVRSFVVACGRREDMAPSHGRRSARAVASLVVGTLISTMAFSGAQAIGTSTPVLDAHAEAVAAEPGAEFVASWTVTAHDDDLVDARLSVPVPDGFTVEAINVEPESAETTIEKVDGSVNVKFGTPIITANSMDEPTGASDVHLADASEPEVDHDLVGGADLMGIPSGESRSISLIVTAPVDVHESISQDFVATLEAQDRTTATSHIAVTVESPVQVDQALETPGEATVVDTGKADIVPTQMGPLASNLAAGVVTVDANNDGAIDSTGPKGMADKPLAGVNVHLKGSNDAHPGWTTTTDADGRWSFPSTTDYSASPEPFTVTLNAAGVANNLYAMAAATGENNDFTREPGQAQKAVSAPFMAADAPVSLNALVYPAWEFDLTLTNDSSGFEGKSVLTGTAPFDDDDEPGNDSSKANNVIRSGDTIAFGWSVTARSSDPLSNKFPNATFEQTITLGDGESANFTQPSPVCESWEIKAYPSGSSIQPKTTPPTGTTSVVLSCNLGEMGFDAAGVILPTGVWVSGESSTGSDLATSARMYATTSDDLPAAQPTIGDVQAGPFSVSAVPRWDVANWGFVYSDSGRSTTFPGEDEVHVLRLSTAVTISTDSKVGLEALSQPITFEAHLWGEYTSDEGQNGPAGTAVPDFRYVMSRCAPSAPAAWPIQGHPVWGVQGTTGILAPPETIVSNPGTCTITRSNPDDLSSPYTITLDGIDFSGANFPVQSVTGGDLSNGPYYVTSLRLIFDVPIGEVDKVELDPNDGVGAVNFYSRVGGFDPNGVTGESNFGEGLEPGYCETGPQSGQSSKCAPMPDGGRSNNVTDVKSYRISTGSFAKAVYNQVTPWNRYNVVLLPSMTSSHDGAAQAQPGEVHGTALIYTNSPVVDTPGVQVCDVFDNTMVRLAPLKRMVQNNSSSLPDDLYSYVLPSVTGDAATSKLFNENFTIEFGHVDLTGDNPNTGVLDLATNRWEGDWTKQRATHCGDVPEDAWELDPIDVPGGIDGVNIVRIRANDGYILKAGEGLWAWLAFEQRDRFHGGPHDGKLIPAGTIFANYGNRKNDTSMPEWRDSVPYIPGAGWTGGTYQKTESVWQWGDRWTVARASLTLKKRTVAGTVSGVNAQGVADFDTAGEALAGRPIVWEIATTVNASSESPAPVQGVTITDTLPKYVTYDDAATRELDGGTPVSSYVVNADGTTTLTWNMGTLNPNEPVTPRKIATWSDPSAPSGTSVVNTATITAEGIITLPGHTDTHSVRLTGAGGVQLFKSVDNTIDIRDDEQKYTLRLKNSSDTFSMEAPTVIDVFSFNGDRLNDANALRVPASDFDGVSKLTEAPQAYEDDGVTPRDGTFYYTTVTPSSVPQDLNNDTDPSIWSIEFTTEATAFKFVASSELAKVGDGSKAGLVIKYTTNQQGNDSGDLYANRFTAFTPTLMSGSRYQLLSSNQTTVKVLGFSIGDLVWIDRNRDGVYTEGVDQPAPMGVTIEVHQVVDGSSNLVSTTTTNQHGRWVVNDLPEGEYFVTIRNEDFASGGLLAGYSLRSAVYPGAPDDDLNEDRDHNGLGTIDRTMTLSATYDPVTGKITGLEPLGDNKGNVELSALTTDEFTNLTWDIALTEVGAFDLPLPSIGGNQFATLGGLAGLIAAIITLGFVRTTRSRRDGN